MVFYRVKQVNGYYYLYKVKNVRVWKRTKQKNVKYIGRILIDNLTQENIDKVFKRDNNRCQRCNSKENLEVDHIVPILKGGDNSLENLQILCKNCNKLKSNKVSKCFQNIKSHTLKKKTRRGYKLVPLSDYDI